MSLVARSVAIVVLRQAFPQRFLAPAAGSWPALGERVALALALAGAPCIAWGFYEPTTLDVSSHRLGAGTLRVVHLSDLHLEAAPGQDVGLAARVAALKPDLIAFTGDALNAPEALPRFRACMRALAAIAPTCAVRGNWDVNYWDALDLFGGTGVHELNGDLYRVTIRGRALAVAGLACVGEAEAEDAAVAALRDRWPAGATRLLLYHTPDVADAAAAAGSQFMLCGHTHGGQIALPGFGAILTLARDGKRFEAGAYQVGGMALYVSRGLGQEGGHAPRVRFLAPPELATLTL